MLKRFPRKVSYAVLTLCVLTLVSCQSKTAAGTAATKTSEPAPPAMYDLPVGTMLQVRLDQQLDTARNRAGDTFTATLDQPVTDADKEMIPKGTQFKGHVTSARPSGRLKGRGHLTVTLDSFVLNGQAYAIETSYSTRISGAHKKRNLALIGGGGGVGAVVGAIAGGGSGAAIGAAAGAGAGTAGAALTGRKQVALPAEAVVRFTLKKPVQIPVG